MKKKGFTLMELIVYLAIAAIITGVTVTTIASVKNFRIQYTNKICQKEMALLIHRARMYCYSRGVSGSINLDISNNKIIFISNNIRIDEFYLQDKKLQNSYNLLKNGVKGNGDLEKSGRISFKDENNKEKEITIHVASRVVDEK